MSNGGSEFLIDLAFKLRHETGLRYRPISKVLRLTDYLAEKLEA
jgi:hypothetical protein